MTGNKLLDKLSYLCDPLEVLVALLVDACLLQTAPDAGVFADESLAVVAQPV